LGDENDNLSMVPQFLPGGGVENSKVRTKRNKRARGMVSSPKEPNNNGIVIQPSKPIKKQTRQSSLQLERQGRASYPTFSVWWKIDFCEHMKGM
jgi:hypothetical protein